AEPCAVLILRDRDSNAGTAATLISDVATIVARANETLAEFQRMRAWFVWPEEDFPRTSTGKPRSNVIRDAVADGMKGAAGEGSAAFAASPLSELLTRVTGRSAPKLAA